MIRGPKPEYAHNLPGPVSAFEPADGLGLLGVNGCGIPIVSDAYTTAALVNANGPVFQNTLGIYAFLAPVDRAIALPAGTLSAFPVERGGECPRRFNQ